MNKTDPQDPVVRTVLQDAIVDLSDIALAVDRASAVVDPTVELLEASHAIHRALILLIEWCHLTGTDDRVQAHGQRSPADGLAVPVELTAGD